MDALVHERETNLCSLKWRWGKQERPTDCPVCSAYTHTHTHIRTHTQFTASLPQEKRQNYREFISAHQHNHVKTSVRSQQVIKLFLCTLLGGALAAVDFPRPIPLTFYPSLLPSHILSTTSRINQTREGDVQATVPRDVKMIMKEGTARLKGYQNNATYEMDICFCHIKFKHQYRDCFSGVPKFYSWPSFLPWANGFTIGVHILIWSQGKDENSAKRPFWEFSIWRPSCHFPGFYSWPLVHQLLEQGSAFSPPS